LNSHARRIYIGFATLAMVLAAAPAALADSSAVDTYGGNGGSVAAGVAAGGSGGSAGSDTSGSLPFTGLDVGLIVGVGLVLLLIGVAMARLSRRADPQGS
jgi:hypothetical protein